VIGGEDHERVALLSGAKERLEDGTEQAVRVRHFAVIGRLRMARREGLRRDVREVRLIEVDPREGPRRSLGRPPLLRLLHRPGPRPLRHEERGARLGIAQAIVVDVEPPVEAEPRVEREGAHEGTRRVAGPLEEGGQRVDATGEPEAGVVTDTVIERVPAGEDVGVRRQRHHVLGMRLLEAHAAGGQAVDPGCLDRPIPVTAEGIRPERVDGDEEDVEARLPAHGSGEARPADQGGDDEDQSNRGGDHRHPPTRSGDGWRVLRLTLPPTWFAPHRRSHIKRC
jgi:hypothetical protein